MNVTIYREDSQTARQITNLQPGIYIVKEVAEVESDGQVTFIRRILMLSEFMITDSPQTTTINIPGCACVVVIT